MESLADFEEIARGRVGRTLRDKWRLDALLGVGGMAAVYAATHRNGKRGAVKVLHPDLSRSVDARSRFLREGYVANTVGHPGAVAVVDDDATEDGLVFMVMELLEGSTLDAMAGASPGRRLPLELVLKAADDLLDVLAVAHGKGIVHRDIKPENLFLARDGTLKVLDFGIARLKQAGVSANATRTGDSMGTPVFMPPEQALGNWSEVDGRTDLWAVGATMFTLLSGRFVHEADTVQKVMLAAMTRDAPPLETVAPVPAPVCAVVNCALARARDERFADARAMQAAIRAARAAAEGAKPQPVQAQAPTLPGPWQGARASVVATAAPTWSDRSASAEARKRSVPAPLILAAIGLLVGLVGVGSLLFVLRSRAAPTPSSAAPAAASTADPSEPPPAPQPSAHAIGSTAPPVEPTSWSSAAEQTSPPAVAPSAARPVAKGRAPTSAPSTFTGRK